MAAKPRSDIFNPRISGVYHCFARCVRQAFLCGFDRYTKKNYEHRREWVEDRVAELAAWFAIDVVFFSVMGNHFHLVLRNLPQLVDKWSDNQVVTRSIKIYPWKFKDLGVEDGKPTVEQMRGFVKDRKLVKELRSRLSDISWFMRQLNHYLARKANAEDGRSGHFFESRFKCLAVTDEMGVLICGTYIDLNQIRAEEAETPETSKRTSAYRRIKAMLARRKKSRKAADWDGFLTPINTRGDQQTLGYPKAGTLDGLRASDKGLLEMSLEDYLQVLDWSGRQLRRDKRGKISSDAPPILERLGISGESLVSYVEQFEDLFHMAVGSAKSVAAFAKSKGRRWLQGAKKRAAIEGS